MTSANDITKIYPNSVVKALSIKISELAHDQFLYDEDDFKLQILSF